MTRMKKWTNTIVQFELMRDSHYSGIASQRSFKNYENVSGEKIWTLRNLGTLMAWRALVSLVAVNYRCSEWKHDPSELQPQSSVAKLIKHSVRVGKLLLRTRLSAEQPAAA